MLACSNTNPNRRLDSVRERHEQPSRRHGARCARLVRESITRQSAWSALTSLVKASPSTAWLERICQTQSLSGRNTSLRGNNASLTKSPRIWIRRVPIPARYPHTNTQLFNVQDDANRYQMADKITAPWNVPPSGTTPNMEGFVTDYVSFFTATMGRQPTVDEYSQIMTGFTLNKYQCSMAKRLRDVRSLVQ